MGGPTDRKFCDEGHPQCKLCWGKCEECDCSPFAICKEHTRKFDTEKEPHKQCPGCSVCTRMAERGKLDADHTKCSDCNACKTLCKPCPVCENKCGKACNNCECASSGTLMPKRVDSEVVAEVPTTIRTIIDVS